MTMEVIEIIADNIDAVTEEIISFLDSRDEDVIYFNGWGGLGASEVLKLVAKRLSTSLLSTGVKGLDGIIHIDCSLWQSKRVLQKLIAQELKLPRHVMAIFDKCDDEDDFDGVEKSIRGVIPTVRKEIFEHVKDTRFLVVFHNGSSSYIDLWECGLPILDLMSNRLLWTSLGRFRLHGIQDEDVKKLAGSSKVAISVELPASDSVLDSFGRLVQAEAKETAMCTGIPEPYMSPRIVIECILYTTLRAGTHGIDWANHVSNYWVCDGIIQADDGSDRSAWEISETLRKNMHTGDWHHVWLVNIRDAVGLSGEEWKHNDRWVSATLENLQELKQEEEHIKNENTATVQVPPHATSFFLIGAEPSIEKNKATPILDAALFGNTKRLRVLHLSYCTFSFSSPPFLSCSNLRFLLLDHCTEKDARNRDGVEGDIINCIHDGGSCFEELWVLEVSYTYWYSLLSETMMGLMANLRELNVKGLKNWSISHLRSSYGVRRNSRRLPSLCKLRVTAESTDTYSNTNQASRVVAFSDMSCSSVLNTIVLDNCTELTHISLKGCIQLKSFSLRGLFEGLVELDISGTAVETLDLSSVQSPNLKRLFLLGCEKLRAILWPQEGKNKPKLEVLRIDTTNAATVPGEDNATEDSMDSYISLRDARLLRSLLHITLERVEDVEISSAIVVPGGHNGEAICSSAAGGKQRLRVASMQKPPSELYEDDIVGIFKDNSQAPYPQLKSTRPDCYIIMQDESRCQLSQGTSSVTLPEFISNQAMSLHLHDSLSVTSIPGPARTASYLIWNHLRWCKLERCPNMEGPVFNPPEHPLIGKSDEYFWYLKTFWASQLQKARCIWDWSATSFRPLSQAFEDLQLLHLDYCPRLKHVLPLCTSNHGGCRSLEVLEIVRCGDLIEVFPLDSDSERQKPRRFPYLKRIHLQDLPKLQRICGRRMFAPGIETVKIRGCWSLRRLPAVGRSPRRRTAPTVDCEKDWWDGLEWDGKNVDHHPSLYRPSHGKYYKKTLLRNSVLR